MFTTDIIEILTEFHENCETFHTIKSVTTEYNHEYGYFMVKIVTTLNKKYYWFSDGRRMWDDGETLTFY